MSNWKELLREHDPAVGVTLGADEAAAMRRRVVSAVPAMRSAPAWWPQPLAIAAMLLLMIVAGVLGGRRLPVAETDAVIADAAEDLAGERRQLQFSTPGGTRIIWVFDPQFDSNGTMP